MRSLLSSGFGYLSEKLLMVPRLLAVMVPPFALDESNTTICLNSPDLISDWGDCTLDVEEHVAEHCADRAKAKYRLAAYVAYVGDEDVMPSYAFSGGHFIAYFSEEGRWYKADDSTVEAMDKHVTPAAFPYLCIFERTDLQAVCPWPPSKTASADVEYTLSATQ